ncbi:MAG: hypothetical protein OHK0039_26360 [Bacteroidia bacterium]
MGVIVWIALLSIPGCTTREASHSALFYEIFIHDSTTFRGSSLGTDMEAVLENEMPEQPVYEDPMGYSFKFTLSPGYLMLVDYFSDFLKRESPARKLSSIVANIYLYDEVETAKIYNEIQAFFNMRYGVATGSYGDYLWQSSNAFTHSMEIRLKLNDDKKGIKLNFVDTDPRQGLPSDESVRDTLEPASDQAASDQDYIP